MTTLNTIVDVEVATSTPGLQRAGFGTGLILSGTAAWVERVRTYATLAEVLVDFATTTQEYLQAQAYFAQTTSPETVKIGRLAVGARPTQRWSIGVALVANTTAYKVEYNGVVLTYTSDASALEAEILTGIAAMLDTADANSSAAVVGSAVVMTITTAGDWKKLRILGPTGLERDATSYLTLVMDAVEPGTTWASELTAILAEDPDWYWVMHPWGSSALNLAVMAWTEGEEKFSLLETQDSAGITAAAGGGDFMQAAETLARRNSAAFFKPFNGQFLAAGLTGKLAAYDPGSYTAKFKTVAGITPDILSTTHTTNITNKHGNWYQAIGGVGIIQEGWTPSGEFIDVIHGIHAFMARVREDVFQLFLDTLKVPFTDAGFAQVEAKLRAVIQVFEGYGFFSTEEAPVIVVVRARTATALQRSTRTMPTITATIRLAGAVHFTHVRATLTP